MNIDQVRKQFPFLSKESYKRSIVYFDNAATMQRPLCVIDKWNELTTLFNSNIHRAVHSTASIATEEYESTREAVRAFIGAQSTKEIIFTSGTTNSINLVAFSFGEAFVHEGDEIMVTEAEHHSNIVPWQMLCQRKGAILKVIPVDEHGYLEIDKIENIITDRTKIICVTHISNVLGIINPIKEIVRIAHKKGVPVLVDGAQGIVHQKLDVKDLDCDFYAFSGHKLYAATGTGVLYGKQKYLEHMPPYMGGGEMIETVSFSGTTYAPLPGKFEAGTQNLNSTPTLKSAIGFINSLDEEILGYHETVKDYFLDYLLSDKRIRLFGVPRGTNDKIALFSFAVNGVHHEDLALILDKMGIAVRSGQMCAEPLMDRYSVSGMLRASLSVYNTIEEVDYFINSLDRAIRMLS